MLSLCVVLSLSLFVNMEMCALVCFPSLNRRLLLSFTKNARSHEQSNENNESRRHLFSSGRLRRLLRLRCRFERECLLRVCKSKQKDGFECEAFFP